MKKIFLLLFYCFFYNFCFSQQDNLIYSETFLTSNIQTIKINVAKQNITIKKYNGEDVLVEMDSNNLCFKSIVIIKDNELIIKENDYIPSQVDYCDIYIYIPFDFVPNSIYTKTSYGNIKIEDISIKEELSIFTDISNINLYKIKVDYLTISSYNKKIECKELKCNSFNITNHLGNIELSLLELPSYSSKIATNTGSIIIWKKNNQNIKDSNISITAPRANLFIKEQ